MRFDRTCVRCSTQFTTHKEHKRYCTKQCYLLSKKNDPVINTCEACGKQFTVAYRFRGQKTCNTKCAGVLTSKRTNTRETKQCLYCGVDFQVTQSYKDKGKYCSLDCFYKHHYNRDEKIIVKTCEKCGKQFKKPFIQRKIRFCSRSCATSGENNAFFGKTGPEHPLFGLPAWNRGLTAQTDERVAELGRKISVIEKEQFASGKRSHRGKNNPNYGNTSDTLTPEKRKNFSEAAIERVLAGVSGYKTGHLTGTYIGKKADSQIRFKSSWELAIMMWWDRCVDVVSYEYEPTIVSLNDFERAVPDFRVFFSDGSTKIYEVKPTAIQNLVEVKEKLCRVKAKLAEIDIEYKLIGNEMIDQIKHDLGTEFTDAVERYKRGE